MKSDLAVTCLIQEMENRREEVIVILAGYSERMRNFMERNEGLKSRIPYRIDFPDYSVEELSAIFIAMTKERGFDVTEEALQGARSIFEKVRRMDNFGNGRYVRNLIERAVQNQSIIKKARRRLGKKNFFCSPGPISRDWKRGCRRKERPAARRRSLMR